MHRTKLFAPLAVAALLFAACGDDDDISTAAVDTDTEQAEVEDTATEDDATEDDGDDGDDGDTIATGECGFLTHFASAFAEFDTTAMYGGGEATDFGAIFEPLAAATAEVAEAAPDEIKDAFRAMADGFGTVAEELEGVVIDFTDPQNMDPEAMEKLENLDTAFDEDFESASEEIDAWMNENCADLADSFDLGGFGG